MIVAVTSVAESYSVCFEMLRRAYSIVIVILEWTTSLDSSSGTLIAWHSGWVSTLRRT